MPGMAEKLENAEYPNIEVEEFTREEIVEEIDREARERLGMTGFEEFLTAYVEGTLPDTLAVNELVILLRVAGLARERV